MHLFTPFYVNISTVPLQLTSRVILFAAKFTNEVRSRGAALCFTTFLCALFLSTRRDGLNPTVAGSFLLMSLEIGSARGIIEAKVTVSVRSLETTPTVGPQRTWR